MVGKMYQNQRIMKEMKVLIKKLTVANNQRYDARTAPHWAVGRGILNTDSQKLSCECIAAFFLARFILLWVAEWVELKSSLVSVPVFQRPLWLPTQQ